MAVDDETSKPKAQATPGEPRKLGRRDVLKGLSTVPALGLFAYAWDKQRGYQQAKVEETVKRQSEVISHGTCLTAPAEKP